MGFFDDDEDFSFTDLLFEEGIQGFAMAMMVMLALLMIGFYMITIAAVLGGAACVLSWIAYALVIRATKGKQKREFRKIWWKQNYVHYGAGSPREAMDKRAKENFEKAFQEAWKRYKEEQKRKMPKVVKLGRKISIVLSVLLVSLTALAMVSVSAVESMEAGQKREMASQVDMSLHDCTAKEFLNDFKARTGYSVSEALDIETYLEPGGVLEVGNYGKTSLHMGWGTQGSEGDVECYIQLLDVRSGDMGKDMVYYVGDLDIFPKDEETIDEYQYSVVQFILPPDFRHYPEAAAANETEEPEVETKLVVNGESGFEEVDSGDYKCVTHFFDYKNGTALDGYFAVRMPKDENSYSLSFAINGAQYFCSLN